MIALASAPGAPRHDTFLCVHSTFPLSLFGQKPQPGRGERINNNMEPHVALSSKAHARIKHSLVYVTWSNTYNSFGIYGLKRM